MLRAIVINSRTYLSASNFDARESWREGTGMVPPAERSDPDGYEYSARDPPAILLVEDEVLLTWS